MDAMPLEHIGQFLKLMSQARDERKTVFLAGNGGSASTASHMANDLLKTIAKTGGKGIKALCLSDNIPVFTAIANDESYDRVFSSQLEVLAGPGDILLLISGSGNSKNLLEAATTAKKLGLKMIGFLGMNGGSLKPLVDISIIVPSDDYGPIEDMHMILNHLLTAYLRDHP